MSCHDIQTWHEILGHCNFGDVQKLENVVDGMSIKSKKASKSMQCEVCVQGKFTQSRNRKPDVRAKSALELVHTDLAGPIDPESREGYRYALSFTDDYSSAVFVDETTDVPNSLSLFAMWIVQVKSSHALLFFFMFWGKRYSVCF